MYITNQMEQFSIAYVYAMCSRLGLNTGDLKVDDDSVDMMITAKNWEAEGRLVNNPLVQVQLKATTSQFEEDGTMHYQLKAKNYNELSGTNWSTPRYLFILHIPSSDTEWTTLKENELVLKYSCYWYSLRDQKELPEDVGSKVIYIPNKNRLTYDMLKLIMDYASKRDGL